MDLEYGNELADYIEAHPEEYDQSMWLKKTECGTKGCVAGLSALLRGWIPINWQEDDYCEIVTYEVTNGTDVWNVRHAGAHELGLDVFSHDANRLFYSNTSKENALYFLRNGDWIDEDIEEDCHCEDCESVEDDEEWEEEE